MTLSGSQTSNSSLRNSNQFQYFDPKGEAEAELEQLHMHENHQAMKILYQFQQLTTHVSGAMQHFVSKLQWSSKVYQK